MLLIKPYGRENAVTYAKRWAFSQNPLFGDFREIGGNCTNFVSQCLYAGGCQMNFTPTFGWYYLTLDERTPSWSGVTYFYNFLMGNTGVGPFGSLCNADELQIGDVIQLGKNEGGYYHSLLVTGFSGEEILVSAQTVDAVDRELSSYTYDFARFIRIEGIRIFVKDEADCFTPLLEGKSLFGTGG
ncbi:MAG: amidase domain-containing protein [Clostridia bacterium]|nr:amidase domain-containing protein [Clostridia bacterium]